MEAEKSRPGPSVPVLFVRVQGSDRILPAGPAYLIGRDPDCDIVIADDRVSWRHAVLRVEADRWVLADNGSTNGIYAGDQRISRVEIDSSCVVRLSHPFTGPALNCAVTYGSTLRIGRAADNDVVVRDPSASGHHAELQEAGDGPLEIPYAVRWLVPRGERFANFGILNDTDTQPAYY